MAAYMPESMPSGNQNKTSWFGNVQLPKPVDCSQAIFPTRTQCEVLHSARQTLSECSQVLQHHQLSTEFFVLNRLLYMKHGQLRREKSFQGLKMIRIRLRKFFSLGLEKSINEMKSYFEEAIVQEGIRVYLPSRPMWEHLLTQLWTSADLLLNTVSRCAVGALHVFRHLKAGMLIPTNTVFLAMISRIWSCCQSLCLEIQSWYESLVSVTGILKPTEFPWLPEGCCLPEDLDVWLKQRGYNTGMDREGSLDDNDSALSSLMTQYQLFAKKGEEGEEDDEDDGEDENEQAGLPSSWDHSVNPVWMRQEHMGERVERVPRNTGNVQQGPSLLQQHVLPTSSSKTSVKEKIQTASSIPDLQRILKKFRKNSPPICGTSKKLQKCFQCLSELQSKSHELEQRGKKTDKLCAMGRKRVMTFFKFVSSKVKHQSQKNGVEQTKKVKKKETKKKKAAERMKKNSVEKTKTGGKESGKRAIEQGETESRKKRKNKNKPVNSDSCRGKRGVKERKNKVRKV